MTNRFDKIKAVIFDLDGTLLDTVGDIGACANRALTQYGYKTYDVNDYSSMVGSGIRETFRQALPKDIDPELFNKVLSVFLVDYPQSCTVHTVYYPRIQEVLSSLAQAGIRLAVITNKTEQTAQIIAAHFFPDIPFEFVWGNNHQRPLKPDTAVGVEASHILNLDPSEIIYVGDSGLDMTFSISSGFVGVGAAWGYRGREALTAAGATAVIDAPSRLLELLKI